MGKTPTLSFSLRVISALSEFSMVWEGRVQANVSLISEMDIPRLMLPHA